MDRKNSRSGSRPASKGRGHREKKVAARTRSASTGRKIERKADVGNAKADVRPWLEKLCLDAIHAELSPHNTKEKIFYLLSAVQLPVLLILSQYLIQDSLFSSVTYINVFGHWIGWFISELIASNKWFDVTEDLVYLFSIIHAFRSIRTPTLSQLAIFSCGFIWIFRLVSFLGYRIIVRGSDWRFDALIKNRSYNLFGWTSGGTWCVLNGFCLWVVAGNNRTIDGPLSLTTIGGIITFFCGLMFETISDWQKFHFADRGKRWIETGLWSISRHPNYLGENICWLGLALASVGALKSPFSHDLSETLLCIVSPVWSIFFLFFTSLMLLEKRANEKWGKQRDYFRYKERVPILLPFQL